MVAAFSGRGRAALGLDPSTSLRAGSRERPSPHELGLRSLRPDGDEVGEAEGRICALAVTHIGVVIVVDVDIGDLLEVTLTGGVDDVHGAGGAGFSVRGILIAS